MPFTPSPSQALLLGSPTKDSHYTKWAPSKSVDLLKASFPLKQYHLVCMTLGKSLTSQGLVSLLWKMRGINWMVPRASSSPENHWRFHFLKIHLSIDSFMSVPEEGHWFGSLRLVGRLPESVNFFSHCLHLHHRGLLKRLEPTSCFCVWPYGREYLVPESLERL